ncbi:hypothetical protein [Rhizobium ruizarguesonis]|uniref:hypothetical protein n=1 Tax=Rhizobium ruizarguesonis TaxID=2081791 RepID=UPI001FDF5929|nr:hypothetical protein [Rhizobium ruizarguesonis]
MPMTKQQHLDGTNGPKRILALDGGGIRGILTLEYLEVMEIQFRRRFNNPNFLLCDYFDLIDGLDHRRRPILWNDGGATQKTLHRNRMIPTI